MLSASRKQYIFLAFLVAVVAGIGFVLIGYIKMPSAVMPAAPLAKPAYLRQTIPSIEKIKNVIESPKFKELQYIKAFFTPITPGEKGRPNPFAPFIK